MNLPSACDFTADIEELLDTRMQDVSVPSALICFSMCQKKLQSLQPVP